MITGRTDVIPMPQAINDQGRLSDEFKAHAMRLFATAKRSASRNLMDFADSELIDGRYPNTVGFTSKKSVEGAVPLRTPLARFQLDDHHRRVLCMNDYVSLTLHQDFDQLASSRSRHRSLVQNYEQIVRGHYYADDQAIHLLKRNTNTPGLQAFMLDITDPWGHLLACVTFEMGDRGTYADYHAYRYDLKHHHIGRFAIVALIQTLKETAAADDMYSGHYYPASRGFGWKAQLMPDVLLPGGWTSLTPAVDQIIRQNKKIAARAPQAQ